MNTITIKDPNGNIVCSVENMNPIKSEEDFPIIRTVDFDAYKLLLVVSQFGADFEKLIPIKFEKENLQITSIKFIQEKDIKMYKNDIIKNPLSFFNDSIMTFELDYIDKNRSIPNHKMCVKILNDQIVNKIKQILSKNGINVNLVIDNGDYPIDLKSDYRGHEAELCVVIKNNSDIADKHDEMFDKYCNQVFKSLIGKKLKNSTITSIEPYDNYSNGICVMFDTLDEFDEDYDLVYELEDIINKTISNCPLNKIYDIKFIEDGYYEGVDFQCNIKTKK